MLIYSSRVVYTEILQQTADSIEALPNDFFTCGTYQLIEKGQSHERQVSSSKRIGMLMLYKLDQKNEKRSVKKLQEIEVNAVLDMKWFINTQAPILSVADSCGNALYFTLTDRKLHQMSSLEIDKNSLCLSTDWCNTKSPEKVVYSLSSGKIALVKYAESQPVIINTWEAHSLEAWIVASDHGNENIFYSGADDCLLKVWDVRMGFQKACFTSKQHLMGVCSIQSSKYHEHVFCSGSYDESIAVWDNRNMREPLSVTETGGGVWRLKWHPFCKHLLLAACMHNGFQIVRFSGNFSDSEILYSYHKHESLAYGVDWCYDSNNTDSASFCSNTVDTVLKQSVVASCSFYDKLLTVWKIDR